MPYGAVPYVPLPYAKPAYEDTSVGRLSDLIRLRGQIAADQAQAHGAASAQKWNAIGRAGGQALSDLAAIPEQNRLRKRQEAEDAMRRQAFQSEQSVRAVQLAEAQGRLGQQQQWNQTVSTNPADPEGFQGPHQPGDEPGAMNWDAIIPKLSGDNLVKAKEAQAHDYEQAAKIDQINNLSIARAAADATNLPEYLKRLELLGSTPQLQWAAERERQAASGLDPSQWEMFQFSKTKGTPFESKPVEMNKDTSLIDPRTTRVMAEGPKSVPTKPQPNEMSVYLDAAGGDAQKALALRNADELRKSAAGRTPKDAAPPVDVSGDVRTTISGKQYVDLGDYGTPSERDKARKAAMAAGVTPVSKEVGASLAAADTAKQNMQAMWAQIESKLPKDAAGRVIVGPKNKLSQFFQTDGDLAAFNSWRAGAIQAVQALVERGMGFRLNQAEINMIMQNDQPQITDTYETAKRRVDNIMTLLQNKENTALTRDRSTLGTDAQTASPLTLDVGGKTYTFPNAAALDGFKKAAGIK